MHVLWGFYKYVIPIISLLHFLTLFDEYSIWIDFDTLLWDGIVRWNNSSINRVKMTVFGLSISYKLYVCVCVCFISLNALFMLWIFLLCFAQLDIQWMISFLNGKMRHLYKWQKDSLCPSFCWKKRKIYDTALNITTQVGVEYSSVHLQLVVLWLLDVLNNSVIGSLF